MAEYKSQHYVPRSYLQDFVDPRTPEGQEPYLWVYEREGETYRRAPKKVATSSYYYSFEDSKGQKDHSVEIGLSRIETAALPCMRALAGGHDPNDLTAEERTAVALFIGLLAARVPAFRSRLDKQLGAVAKMLGQLAASEPSYFNRTIDEAIGPNEITDKEREQLRESILQDEFEVELDPRYALGLMVEAGIIGMKCVFGCHWRVLEAPGDFFFITSDRPVAMITTENVPGGYGTGWATPGMEAILTLSPSAALLMSLQHRPGRETIGASEVREVNYRIIATSEEAVFSSRELEESELTLDSFSRRWQPLSRL